MKEWHEIPERVMKKRAIKAVICDCCGARKEGEDVGPSPNWANHGGEVKQVCVTLISGWNGDVDDESFDLCYDCANWLMWSMKNGRIVRPKAVTP